MSRTPILLRVRLAFDTYPVGYLFHSPPLPGTLRQEWLSRGYLEELREEKSEAKADVSKPKEIGRKRMR